MADIKAKIPASAAKGEVFEIKTVIKHPMESGQRKGEDGKLLPKKIINKFVCTYNGAEVVSADWYTGVASDPIMSFFVKANESGKITLAFTDDDGSVYSHRAEIKVS